MTRAMSIPSSHVDGPHINASDIDDTSLLSSLLQFATHIHNLITLVHTLNISPLLIAYTLAIACPLKAPKHIQQHHTSAM